MSKFPIHQYYGHYKTKKQENTFMSKHIVSFIDIFNGITAEMLASLKVDRENISHAVCKGDTSETKWKDFLKTHLPPKYSVDKAIVVNKKGEQSQQIDIVIYDAANAPFSFRHNDFVYVPIECVRAVFEVKQSISKKEIIYAKEKAESVRKLADNSNIHNIIAGFLALEYNCETHNFDQLLEMQQTIMDNLSEKNPNRILNCGCCLSDFSFADEYGIESSKTDSEGNGKYKYIVKKEKILVAFLFRLLYLLCEDDSQERDDINKYIIQFGIEMDDGCPPLFNTTL